MTKRKKRRMETGEKNPVSLETHKVNFLLLWPPLPRPVPAPPPISLIPLCSSLPHSLSFIALTKADFFPWWICHIFFWCGESWKAGGSVGHVLCCADWWSLRLGCSVSFWPVRQHQDVAVVGEAATMLAWENYCMHTGAFKRRGGGLFISYKVSLFSFSHPINFPCALFLPSLWLSNEPTGLQAFLQVLLFQHLNHNPPQLFSPHSVLPSLFLPVSFLSLSTMVMSHGGRQLAGCRLAAMATGTLPLPKVSLATSSLAL